MNDWGPWGPDIVFLRVPSHHVGTIEAYKVFYNLSKRRREAMDGQPELDMGPWVLMGAPELEGDFTQVHASLRFPGYFSRIMQVHTKGDLDYLDIGVDLSLPGLPSSFGGLSGGGLWHVLLTKSSASGEFSWQRSLEGVAFFESPPEGGRRIIRCHGRQSIYGRME